VLYDQDMIDGDTSLEGLVDDGVFLSKTAKNSDGTAETGQIQRVKTRFSKRNGSYVKPNFGHSDLPNRALGGGKQQTGGLGREVGRNRNQAREHDLHSGQQRRSANRPEKITIDNDTPRRSARCPKPSEKMIQIKKELQEETDSSESDEDFKVVKNSVKGRKIIVKVELQDVDNKTRIADAKTQNDPKKLVYGLRRSSRISKPTKEILEFRKATNDEDVNEIVKTRGAHHKKFKLTADPKDNSLVNIKVRKSVHVQYPNPVDENSNLRPNTRSHTFNTGTASNATLYQGSPTNLSCEWENLSPSMNGTTLKTRSGKSLGGQWKLTRSISAHNTAMTNSPSNTKLVSSATRALSASPGVSNQPTEVPPPPIKRKVDQPPSSDMSVGVSSAGTSRIGADGENLSIRTNSLIVLTEAENDEVGGVHFSPDGLMDPVGDPRNWNCFQCVYQLTRLDERLAITDLDPLMDKKVDGDALIKSSLSDLVNVVGMEYSPAVRVVFLMQQMGKEAANCGSDP